MSGPYIRCVTPARAEGRTWQCPRCGLTATETLAPFVCPPICGNRDAHPRDITMTIKEPTP